MGLVWQWPGVVVLQLLVWAFRLGWGSCSHLALMMLLAGVGRRRGQGLCFSPCWLLLHCWDYQDVSI